MTRITSNLSRLGPPRDRAYPRYRVRIVQCVLTLNAFFIALGHVVSTPLAAEEPVDFLQDIKPLLAEHCFDCHGAESQESGLRLDNPPALLEGGYSGPALVAGHSAESLLLKAVRRDDEHVAPMPPEGPGLSTSEILLLQQWIDQGAAMPTESIATEPRRKGSNHWSFQPIRTVDPPQLDDQEHVRNPIDAFVLARLRDAGLEPSPAADQATLIRRLSLDLTGLPPTIAEVDSYLADYQDGAYERLVERLLHSPHFGEHWGRHWLDVARYADSNGYTIDRPRSIWKYRDWVIEALNRDLPFDQFVIEQIAGDLLPAARLDQRIATGFHRNTLVNEEGGTDDEQFRVEAVADRVATTGAAFLGLTLGCARCHDHKYDPVTQREFYQLFAFFNNCDEPTLPLPSSEQSQQQDALQREINQMEKQLATIVANSAERQATWEKQLAQQLAEFGSGSELAELPPPAREALATPSEQRTEEQLQSIRDAFLATDPEHKAAQEELTKLNARKKSIDSAVITTLIMRERSEPRITHIHLRGNFLSHGAVVKPAVPAVLPPLESRNPAPNRLDLARWLVSADNPLTARVMVNRVWQRYFGRGLVATENDLGLQGEFPSHPLLLDWLSRQFIDSGWSLKSLHRLIVTSSTYRQSSLARSDLAAADPENKLLGRQQRLRLQAENIRDVALAASGLLSPRIGGPSVFPPQPDSVYLFTQTKQEWNTSQGDDRYRRGMYTCLRRSSPYPFLKTFDAPDATVTCTRRPRSNTPLQALTLANDLAYFEIAQGFALSLLGESAASEEQRLRSAFRRCLTREPTAAELSELSNYLELQKTYLADSPRAADAIAPEVRPEGIAATSAATWTLLARVLLNLDEFITRE